MKLFEALKSPFRKPSPDALALAELEDAKRSLLEAQSAAEYATSVVQYNMSRISRLQQYVKEIA